MLPASLSDLIARRKDLSPKQLADLLEKIKTFAKQEGYLSEHQIPDTPGKFALKYSNGDWQLYDYLKVIDDKLGILEHGKTDIPRLIVNVPPQHGKSSLISFWLPIWLLARNPKRRIILVSYEHEYAASWGAKVRDWIRDNGEELGLVLDSSSTARHDWKLTAGGGMQTAGVGGPITGKSADVLIVDDPIKNEEEASSETIREKMWSWFQTAPMTRLQQHSFVVAIGTRWHEDDLLGRLERYSKLDPETGERAGLEWDIVKFKAISENDDPLGRAPGEPLCPERFTLSKLQEFRRGMTPYHWSALYQQTPTPEEGTAVKRAWWQYYEDVPRTENGDYDFDMMVQSWDLSFKDMKRNDYCVGQVWGRKGSRIYLVDQIRGHMNAPEVIAAIKTFQQKYKKAIGKLVEDSASGPAIIQLIQHDIPGIIPIKTKNQSKDIRLQSVLPLIQAGNIHLPRPEKFNWVNEFVEEHAMFPNGAHDDMLDACVHALRYLQPQAWMSDVTSIKQQKIIADAQKTPEKLRSERISQILRKQAAKRTKALVKEAGTLTRLPSRRLSNW